MTMPERGSGNAAAEVCRAGSATGAPKGEPRRKCEICSSSAIQFLFRLPCFDGPYSKAQSGEDRPYWRCSNCGFVFTTAYNRALYETYYQALPGDYHRQHDRERSRYELVRSALNGNRSLRVLDYGCGTGMFLSSLPSSYEKYGIEPSLSAAAEAQRKGIHVITPDELTEPTLRRSFDVVVSIDVVEHVNGLSELRKLFSDSLRDGGLLLLLTGNVESKGARRAGRYWYYLQYAEHVSFLAERSARCWLGPDFEKISFEGIIHHPATFSERMSSLVKFPIGRILEKLGAVRQLRRFPKLHTTRDHIFISARRRSSNGGSTE